jgi:two-component system nitrogen regulation response regulator GlnG
LALILLVDDDAAFRNITGRVLRDAGHRVSEAGDGIQALQAISQTVPDIVVTDVLMPNCDGIELISSLRQRYPTVRILAISANESLKGLSVLNLAHKVGADITLPKSVISERLVFEVGALASGGL